MSIKCWPRVTMAFKGEDYGPGDVIEVHDEYSIGIIGAQPAPRKYLRISREDGAGGWIHSISDTATWKEVDEATADAWVEGKEPPAEEAPAKHHHRGRKAK